MGLDTYLNLKVKNKETGKFSEFAIIYFRKCHSITDKMRDILYNTKNIKMINEDYYEYPLSENSITEELLKCLTEEEDTVRRHCIDLYTNKDDNFFTFEAFWTIDVYIRIISREVDNLTDFFIWQCMMNMGKRDMDFFDSTYIEMEDYDWDTAIIEFCASW
jgi:hypothetical protein